MSHWRSGTFWASAIFAGLLTFFGLGFGFGWLLSVFGSEDMSPVAGIVANVAIVFLSLVAAYAYGRRQFEARKPKQVGFPVIAKDGGDSTAG